MPRRLVAYNVDGASSSIAFVRVIRAQRSWKALLSVPFRREPCFPPAKTLKLTRPGDPTNAFRKVDEQIPATPPENIYTSVLENADSADYLLDVNGE